MLFLKEAPLNKTEISGSWVFLVDEKLFLLKKTDFLNLIDWFRWLNTVEVDIETPSIKIISLFFTSKKFIVIILLSFLANQVKNT